jgi:hypothetical protein
MQHEIREALRPKPAFDCRTNKPKVAGDEYFRIFIHAVFLLFGKQIAEGRDLVFGHFGIIAKVESVRMHKVRVWLGSKILNILSVKRLLCHIAGDHRTYLDTCIDNSLFINVG